MTLYHDNELQDEPPAELVLPAPEDLLALRPDFLAATLAEQLATQPAAVAEDLERKARALQEHEKRNVEAARRYATVALVSARHLGAELGEGKRGRPVAGEEIPLPHLDREERREYRLCAELTDEEFASWLVKARTLTRAALARRGAEARKARDRDTGEPIGGVVPPRPAGAQDPESAPPPADPPSGDTPEEGPGELEVEPPPRSHQALACLQLLVPLEEQTELLPAIAAKRCGETLTTYRRQIEALNPTTSQETTE